MVEAAITTSAIIGGLVVFLGLPVTALAVAISSRRFCALLCREAERLEADIPDDLRTAIIECASEIDSLKDRMNRKKNQENGARGGRPTRAATLPPEATGASPGGNGVGLPALADRRAWKDLVRSVGKAKYGD